MKKITLLFAALALVGSAFSQEALTNKKGQAILPTEGDCALGFNALPILNYMGNALNGTDGTNFVNNGSFFVNSDNMIYAKYMASDNMAYRIRLRVRNNNTTRKNYVIENGAFSQDTTVEDSWNNNDQLIGFSAGFEKRRGSGRIVGVYGVELGYSTASTRDKYTYGNAMDDTYNTPLTTTDFNFGSAQFVAARTLDVKWGRTHNIGLQGFAGVEYFFAPKIALTGEFTWGVSYTTRGDSEVTTELYTTERTTTKTTTAGLNSLGIDTGNYGGAIGLLSYF